MSFEVQVSRGTIVSNGDLFHAGKLQKKSTFLSRRGEMTSGSDLFALFVLFECRSRI